MKASLLARTAPALLIAGFVAGGLGAPALAQTTQSATAPGTSAPANPAGNAGASAAPGTTTTAPAGQHRTTARTRQPTMNMQEMVERRITDLHAKLHITQAQTQEWDQFAQLMRSNAKDLDQAYEQRAQRLMSMSAPENLQSYAQLEQTRAQDVQKLVPTFQNLYDALSPQQKKDADQLFRTEAQRYERGRQTSTR